ncbi:hypothetical protein FRY74_09785 [Vicingus serpentipes]|uniref:Uncharacterized protein n=1 Tax=Vicingus serpentipes TaxID=1926625 RepID=A0A5C6RTQ3_9FLAO|nr:hypothetical protein [Vicingus serpentipes]TXB64732.1 hypothetical protein FRY74_09785 [Vicingus serpentipes]
MKYSFVYLAAFIMLLHNFIPHSHKSELSNSEHQQIHQTESSSPIDLLALVFHEFTEDGEMEEVLPNTNTAFAATFFLFPIITNSYNFSLEIESELLQHPLPKDERLQFAGFLPTQSVRPPPSA